MHLFLVRSCLSSFLILFISLGVRAESLATVGVTLSPAGSFVAKTADVKGEALQQGDTISASNIVVNLNSLKTGIETRDKHTLKHLETDKFPNAILISATGKGGKGQGKIKIKDIEKNISGTYTISGHQLEAEFSLKLSDFKITGIRYMSVGVKDDVKIHVVIPITTQAAALAPPANPSKNPAALSKKPSAPTPKRKK
jgi:hypothetical protein